MEIIEYANDNNLDPIQPGSKSMRYVSTEIEVEKRFRFLLG
jgi:hypothetical protein